MPAKYETHVLQDPVELNHFFTLLREEGVKSYLEIGSKNGGSLWRIANNALPKGSRLVSVDLPHGDTSFKETEENLRACVQHLKAIGFDAHLILGDSTNPETIEKARALGPYDAILIDANHTEPYVRQDWANYGPMSKRIVCFHDIGWIPREGPTKKMPIEVPRVWNEIKQQYRHREIKMCHTGRDNGIGILWR
jgi:predicted O-methyltransferase YrrM